MSMSFTKAKAVAKDPESYSIEELDEALDFIVNDYRLTEAQVTKMQAKIDPVLRARLAERQSRIAAAVVWPDMADGRPTADDCTHPAERQSSDRETNEVLCEGCGWLRDLMPWEEWAQLPTEAHLIPIDPADGRPTAP